MEKSFPRSFDVLDEIAEFIGDFLADEGLPTEAAFVINLIVEELFTNLVKYNRDGSFPILVNLERDGSDVVITLVDRQVKSFDITAAPEVDTGLPITERTPGGLGIHLVRMLADTLTYEHAGGDSLIRVRKRWEDLGC